MDDRRLLLAAALGFGGCAALLLTVARRARRRDADAAAVETAEATWMPEATLVAVLSGLDRWGWREEGGGVYIHIWFYNYIICVYLITAYI